MGQEPHIDEQMKSVIVNEQKLKSLYQEIQKQMQSKSVKKAFDSDDMENIKNIFDMLVRDADRHIQNLDQMSKSSSKEDLAKIVM